MKGHNMNITTGNSRVTHFPKGLKTEELTTREVDIQNKFESVAAELKQLDETAADVAEGRGEVSAKLEREIPPSYDRATYRGSPLSHDPSPREFEPTYYSDHGRLSYDPESGEVSSLEFEPHYAGQHRLNFELRENGDRVYTSEQIDIGGSAKTTLVVGPDGGLTRSYRSPGEHAKQLAEAREKEISEAMPTRQELLAADRAQRGVGRFVPTADEIGSFMGGALGGGALNFASGVILHSSGTLDDHFPWEDSESNMWRKIGTLGPMVCAAAGVATIALAGPAGAGAAALIGMGGPALVGGVSMARISTAKRLHDVRDDMMRERLPNRFGHRTRLGLENWQSPR